MNLLRNHIIYYRYQIKECCEENGIMLPEEMKLACPPIVNDYYMARLDQESRLKNIGNPEKITTEKMPYDEYQNV